MTTYKLTTGKGGIAFRGAAQQLWNCKDHEVIIAGPAETGKTFAALHKLDALLWKYSGAQGVIVRKVYNTTVSSVGQTYVNKVITADGGIRPFGGEHPQWYDYPNGSRLWVGGMDTASKVLSSERDFIYVNQAEELSKQDWETLTTRCTGRAGNAPYAQIFGDCNPAGRTHWILERQRAGKLTLLKSTHKDNPTLFDDAGEITAQGRISLGVLEGLSGALYHRLYLGEWYSADGVIYEEWNRDIHVCHREVSEFQRFIVGCDEGYTNPAVALVVGIDGDGREHWIEEFYQSRVLQASYVDECKRLNAQYKPDGYYVDPSAAGLIAEMRKAGLRVFEADNAVNDGIQAVKALLKVQGDGRPRLTVEPTCVNAIAEFESYVWAKDKAGNPTDKPLKENDHAMDSGRYAAKGLGAPTKITTMPSLYGR